MTAVPLFQIGDVVEVISNGGMNTPRAGIVDRMVWHHKENRFFYFIRVGSRKVSKRYAAEDLRLVASASRTDSCDA